MKVTYLLYKDKLKGEYAETFDKIELYSNVDNIDFDTTNEMLSELLDVFLISQQEEKPVKKIVGSNIKQFCRLYFENYSLEQRIRKIAKQINYMFLVLFVIELISLVIEMPEDLYAFFKLKTDITAYLVAIFGAIILSNIFNLVVKKMMFTWKCFSTKTYNIMVFGSVFLVIPTASLMMQYKVMVFVWTILLITVVYIIGYYSIKILEKKRLGKTVFIFSRDLKRRKIETGEKITFTNAVKEKLPKEMIKRYKKINKRRIKKGKEIITHEEFMEKIKKEHKKELYFVVAFYFIIVGIILTGIMVIAKDSSLIDTVIFAVTICVCEIPVFLYARFLHLGINAKTLLFEECDKEGKDIFSLFTEN